MQHSNFLSVGCVVCIFNCTVTLAQNYLFNDEIFGAFPNMNIKVSAYVIAYLHYYNWNAVEKDTKLPNHLSNHSNFHVKNSSVLLLFH